MLHIIFLHIKQKVKTTWDFSLGRYHQKAQSLHFCLCAQHRAETAKYLQRYIFYILKQMNKVQVNVIQIQKHVAKTNKKKGAKLREMQQEVQDLEKEEQEEPSQDLEKRFQRLRETYSDNAFILVGPKNSFFQGSLAIQFAALTITEEVKVESQVDFTFKGFVTLQTQNVIGNKMQHPKHSVNSKQVTAFQSTIPNKSPKAVICLDDSEPVAQDHNSSSNKQSGLFQLPIFQNDGIHYTPTFAAQYSKLTKTQYHSQFMNKVKDYRRQVSKDFIPRPRSKYMYCGICKDHYEEYLGHVNSKRHIQNYQTNTFTKYIKSLELTINTGTFKKEKLMQQKRKVTYQKKRKMKEEEGKKNKKQDKNKKQQTSSQKESSSQDDSDSEENQKVKIQKSQSQSQSIQREQKRERTRDKKNVKTRVKKNKKVRSRKNKKEETSQSQSQKCKKQ